MKKGKLIAQMFKSKNPSEGAHIHFHLATSGGNTFFCPNIFNEDIALLSLAEMVRRCVVATHLDLPFAINPQMAKTL